MTKFKFSVGPWNVHSGADSYGPATRDEIAFEEKIRTFAELGFPPSSSTMTMRCPISMIIRRKR